MDLSKVVIETKRLRIQPISEKNILDVYKNFTIDITQYMYPQPTGHIKDAEVFIRESMKGLKEGTNLQMVMVLKDTDEFIGCLGLHNVGTPDPELGLWVKKSAHSHGYGLEGIRGIVEWARENLELDHFRYPVDRNNRSSRRIPVTIGGSFAKSYKRPNMDESKILDIVEYWIPKQNNSNQKVHH
jgi:RimJ/RimL family protein N-acetyltransferase